MQCDRMSHTSPFQPIKEETKSKTSLKPVFDKYVIENAKDLQALNRQGLLKGAFVITGDKEHVGVHNIFWLAQIIKQLFESIMGVFEPKRPLDSDLCHGMVVVDWSEEKNCPIIAHSVTDGVKLSTVDYFNYEQKDIDHMVVYVPKDKKLRDAFAKNAYDSAQRSTKKSRRLPFSWVNTLTAFFKEQKQKTPHEETIREVAFTATDLLLNRNLAESTNTSQPRQFYCMEYASQILQASVLTRALEEENDLLFDERGKRKSREQIANSIFARLMKKDTRNDPLAKAYWESRICTKLPSNGILPAYAAYQFDKISEEKNIPSY